MKKITTLFTLMAGASLAFGQANIIHNPGAISYQNSITGGGNHKVYKDVVNTVTGTLLLGNGTLNGYVAELYYLNTTTSSLTPITSSISPFKASTTSQPGTWNGPVATVDLPAGYGGVDVFDDGSGEAGSGGPLDTGLYPTVLAVRVWDKSLFATYELAKGNGLTGDSGNFTYTQRFTVPANPNDTAMLTQKAFALVPEPSAIALSVLGVAGLLLIRRRK